MSGIKNQKGHIAWNKGLRGLQPYQNISGLHPHKKGEYKHSDETRLKMSNSQRGSKKPWISQRNRLLIGSKSLHWKGGVSETNRLARTRFRNTVQKEVLRRDNYTCQICGIRGINMQVDHIQPWKEYIELRFSIDNCRTLCSSCHYQITFGRPMPKKIKTWGLNFKQLERRISS